MQFADGGDRPPQQTPNPWDPRGPVGSPDDFGGYVPPPPPPGYGWQPGGYSGRATGGVRVIGILSIAIGSFCSICSLLQVAGLFVPQQQPGTPNQFPPQIQEYMDDALAIQNNIPRPYQIIEAFLNQGLSIVLLVSGIGTLTLRRWARTLANVYAIAFILAAILSAVVEGMSAVAIIPQLKRVGETEIYLSMCLVTFAAAAYPVVLLIFYNRASVKQQFNGQYATPTNAPPPQPPYMQ